MERKTNLSTHTTDYPAFGKRVAIGASIALAVIMLFTLPVKPDPSWPKFWIIRPLLLTPFAGGIGGAIAYYLGLRTEKTLGKVFSVILGILVYLFVLWMGIILGLDGTMWD